MIVYPFSRQPSLLGSRLARHIPPYSGYKADQEPAVAVEFASGAYRLHGLIRVGRGGGGGREGIDYIHWNIPFFLKEFYQLADANFRLVILPNQINKTKQCFFFRKIGDVHFVNNAGSVELILRTGTDQLIRLILHFNFIEKKNVCFLAAWWWSRQRSRKG